MNEKQRKAYEWAKNQQYNSVAADYARELAGLVDSLTEENKALRRELKEYRELGTVEELDQALMDAAL